MPNKSISFKDTYQEQYDFLMLQDNPSQFVCELIKSYMESEDGFNLRVEKIVANYINKNFQFAGSIIEMMSGVKSSSNYIEEDETFEDLDIEDPW
ncbi:hypothetical protein [Clostridium sp.]|uniref:hypothetical protein n=1 Tax=Clostridium sp. TaxID=1506 RepID=UPI003F2CFF10